MEYLPAAGELGRLSGVEADLEAGRTVHHLSSERPHPVEGRLQRVVARGVEKTPRWTNRIGPLLSEAEPAIGEDRAEGGRIGSGGRDESGYRIAGGGRDFDLPARLDGDLRAGGKCAVWRLRVDGVRCIGSEGVPAQDWFERSTGVGLVVDRPFELESVMDRWAHRLAAVRSMVSSVGARARVMVHPSFRDLPIMRP